ncbi:MAG: hypothetical protein ABW185_15395 [Sedimenticola sp.]
MTERAGLPVTGERVVSGAKRTVTEEGGEPEPALATGCMMTSIWSMLLARIYEINPLVCSRCGGEMRIIAFVTER